MNPHDQALAASDRRAAWIAAFLLFTVAGFYALRRMPWVHMDDLAFAGAAIDLARTGELTNQTMNGWLATFGTNKFYIQLPFFTYSLAWWLRIFGVGTASLSVFQWVWYFVGGFGLVRLLGRFKLPLGMRLFVATLYLTDSVEAGFRPEPEAFSLLWLGLSLVDTAASSWRKLAALVCLGFGVLAYPLVLAVGVPFTAALLWLQRVPGSNVPRWRRETLRAWLLPGGVAAAVVGMSFLAMIHCDLRAFFNVFEAHRHARADPPEGMVTAFIHSITRYQEAVLTLPVVLLLAAMALFVAWRWHRVEPAARLLVTACTAAAVGCVYLYQSRAVGYILLLSLCAGFGLASVRRWERYRWPAALALSGLLIWSHALWIVDATLRRFPDETVLRQARDTALRSGKMLVVDSSTARYVFNYHLPERTLSLNFMRPVDSPPLTMADKKADACWIVSKADLAQASQGRILSERDYPHISIGHHAFVSRALQPDDPIIFP